VKKLSKKLGGQYLALTKLSKDYKTNILGLKLGSDQYVVVFGRKLVQEIFVREEFQGRPEKESTEWPILCEGNGGMRKGGIYPSALRRLLNGKDNAECKAAIKSRFRLIFLYFFFERRFQNSTNLSPAKYLYKTFGYTGHRAKSEPTNQSLNKLENRILVEDQSRPEFPYA